MPKFKLTLSKEFIVDTDEWEEAAEGDDDDDEGGGNWFTENLAAANVDPANATPEQLIAAMRQCLADDLEEVVDLEQIGSDDFKVELVGASATGRT